MAREWFIDITDASSNGGVVTIQIDLAGADVAPMPAGTYYLLYRASQASDFIEAGAVAYTGTGNVDLEDVDTALLADGFYTLGAMTPFVKTLVPPPVEETPVLVHPADGMNGVATQFEFAAWSHNDTSTEAYNLYLSPDAVPTEGDLFATVSAASDSTGLGSLEASTTYFWKLEAFFGD